MIRIALPLLWVACAATSSEYIKPPQELLRDASALPPEDACAMLTKALASGDYSSQLRTADSLTSLNNEFSIGQARDHACRTAEKLQKRGREIETEQDLSTLRFMAWSQEEDEPLRRRAAARLLELVKEERRPDVISGLAAMVPKSSDWPEWYLLTGVEQAIEEKAQMMVRTPEENARINVVLEKFSAVQGALAAFGLAAAQGKTDGEEKDRLHAREKDLEGAWDGLSPTLKEAARQNAKSRFPKAEPSIARYLKN
jgi:hypothetical protein